jgi:hypothetical protein
LSNEDDDDHGNRGIGQDEPLIGPHPAANDVEVLGKTYAEMIISDTIVTGARRDIVPPITNRSKAASTSSDQVRKCPCIVAKRPPCHKGDNSD